MLTKIFPKNELVRHVFTLWFILAVVALAFSGIYSFLPYALRTPVLAKILNLPNLFNLSLMVHVNLGVLVWFMSSAAMLACLIIKEKWAIYSFVSFIIAMVGTLFIIFSPFIGSSEPVKNDYIPILHNFVFILGISLFLCSILLQSILGILSWENIKRNTLKTSIYIICLIYIVACLCFIKSAYELKLVTQKRFVDLLEFYQLLFWGPGHILQFCYVQLIIFAWIILISDAPNIKLNKKLINIFQWINFICTIPTIFIYWIYSVDSPELYNFFTYHMKYFGGNLIMVIGLIICYNLVKSNIIRSFSGAAILSSLLLLGSGGVIGFLINGANVTVPAHYHGVILGITVSLMGMFYKLLPELGFKGVNNKSANWQLALYSLGQFIHVLALAISGGYGVLRKDPLGKLSMKAKFFMGVMGIGGSIALIGGILFVILIFKNLKGNNS